MDSRIKRSTSKNCMDEITKKKTLNAVCLIKFNFKIKGKLQCFSSCMGKRIGFSSL
jgi:hypothetical protein